MGPEDTTTQSYPIIQGASFSWGATTAVRLLYRLA